MPGNLKVLIASGMLQPEFEDALEPLRALGAELVRRPLSGANTEDEVIAALQGCSASIASVEPYTEKVFAACPELKVVARTGVGYDAIDVAAATRHGVVVSTTPGANHQAVADFAVTLMLACARQLLLCDAKVRRGDWDRPLGVDLWGATVGIIGLGRIGKEVAKRIRGFDCQVLATELYPDHDFVAAHGIELVPLDELLRRADFVTIHSPLDAGTRSLIGARELALMKPSAYLINTARGPIVDEAALIAALRERRIAGAGLDVFEREPLPTTSPLVALDNVVLAPHVAGITRRAVHDMLRMACENAALVLSGRPPLACVNPEVLQRS